MLELNNLEMNAITMKNILITGAPGIGKTTLIKKLADALNDFHPAGFYTAEIREGGADRGVSHEKITCPYRAGRIDDNR